MVVVTAVGSSNVVVSFATVSGGLTGLTVVKSVVMMVVTVVVRVSRYDAGDSEVDGRSVRVSLMVVMVRTVVGSRWFKGWWWFGLGDDGLDLMVLVLQWWLVHGSFTAKTLRWLLWFMVEGGGVMVVVNVSADDEVHGRNGGSEWKEPVMVVRRRRVDYVKMKRVATEVVAKLWQPYGGDISGSRWRVVALWWCYSGYMAAEAVNGGGNSSRLE
ncbi:hypothetical protein L1987_61366 [Smallanthus sonchifolius]|uniref:Uncharacterized protein n=1 Tax=Smallanthus sonchifolius TaxID=185202 RepID=A0ACB9DAT5_9ASTR|nr:hypothetical protein L1987_61366 [Smallanthus sonchifolius]